VQEIFDFCEFLERETPLGEMSRSLFGRRYVRRLCPP
jgi:hypothetical protein